MSERELSQRMIEAARRATDAALAAGHSRADKVTKDSAFRAAEEVYLAERGERPAATRSQPVPDTWQDRADLT